MKIADCRLPRVACRVLLAALLSSATLLFAGFTDDVGGFPGMLLNYGGSPRTLSMGKAFTGLANDAEAGYFNPAGLVQLNAQNIKLSHDMLYADCNMEYLAYAMPTRSSGTFGLTLMGWLSASV